MNLPTLETLLGGLSAREFLAEYWQKKPLLIRQAVPGFTGVLGQAGAERPRLSAT